MTRPNGGIIAGTQPPWTTTATSGIFTLREAQVMRTAAQWPRGPVAPTGFTATAGNAQLSLSWTAPATTHGTITNYLVEYTPSGGSPQYVLTNSTSTSYALTGLTNGTAYTARVAAVNFTAGDYSGTATATPASGPTITVTGGSGLTGAGTNASRLTGSFSSGTYTFLISGSGTLFYQITSNSCENTGDTCEMWHRWERSGSPIAGHDSRYTDVFEPRTATSSFAVNNETITLSRIYGSHTINYIYVA